MTSRIHRFRELTVTHTAYEACVGRQSPPAAFSKIQTAPGTYDMMRFFRRAAFCILREARLLRRAATFFFQRAASCLWRAACYSQRAAGYFLRASCCIWRVALCLRSAAFNLMMATLCSRRAVFYILRAIRRLQRTATLRGRHHTFGGRRVVRRGRQSTF